MQQDAVEQLDGAVAQVFEVMLGLPCLPAAEECGSSDGYAAHIRLSGAILGSSTLELGAEGAGALARRLGVSHEDHADLIGELCNMITGCWKARQNAARGECKLSPPLYSTCSGGFRHRLRRSYRCLGHCLWFTLAYD